MQYERTLRELVEQYAAEWKPHDGTSIEAVTDRDHGHYQIVRSGWKAGRFIHSCLVHFALRGEKVQLLKNDTDVEWDRELVDRGIPQEDIELTFRQVIDHRTPSGTMYSDTDNTALSPSSTPVLKS